jgi:hypothetical protein
MSGLEAAQTTFPDAQCRWWMSKGQKWVEDLELRVLTLTLKLCPGGVSFCLGTLEYGPFQGIVLYESD